MFKKLRDIGGTKLAGIVLYRIARLYCSTLRVTTENEKECHDYLKRGGRVLICLWHQQMLPTVLYFNRFKQYQPCVMTSKSRDGEISTRMVEAAGLWPVRGSSSSGGVAALRRMIERIRKHQLGAHTLDGPRGPAGEVKLGAIAIADGAGASVIPLVMVADNAWYLKSWDRFMVPKPFSKLTVKFMPKIDLPPEMDKEEYEEQRKKLEAMMHPYLKL